MKIIVLLIALYGISNACVCPVSYADYENALKISLNAQRTSLSALKTNIETSKNTLEEQIKILKQNNAILKENIIKNDELLFLLKQRNNVR